MRTKARWPSLLACAFLMSQIRFEQQALADQHQQQLAPTASTSDVGPTGRLADGSQLSQQQLRHLKKLSCHVCTTMDYENPNDNACKDMIKYKLKTASYHAAPMMGFHQTTMQPPTTQETRGSASKMPFVSSSLYLSPNSDGNYDEESTTMAPAPSLVSNHHQPRNFELQAAQNSSSSNYNTTTTTSNPNLELQQQHQTSIIPVQDSPDGFYSQYRVPLPKNYTRVRTCSEEENFCSTVSVVSLEFHNDKLVPRFWAMERNCSKSCNNGCMVIGERVRLRVCSNCCFHPNCNYVNGASKALNISYTQHTHKLVAMLLVSLIMASGNLSIQKSYHVMLDH